MSDGGDSGQSKTFMPSPRRLEKAREEGNALFVNQINTGVVLFTFFVIFPEIALKFMGVYFDALGKVVTNGNKLTIDKYTIHLILAGVSRNLFTTITGVVVIFAIAAFACSVIQLKGLRVVPLKFKVESFNIAENAQQKFSRKNLVKLILDIAFIVSFLFIGFILCQLNLRSMVNLIYVYLGQQLIFLNYLYVRVVFLVAISLAVFLILMYSVEEYFYIENLMMTREEVEKEQEENEGKAEVKNKLRELRYELYEDDGYIDQLLKDLGTFVVSNPTHYAILLFYCPDTLPLVLIKGKGGLAQLIMKRARIAGVPVIQHKYVAQQLFKLTKPGDYIPKILIRDIGQIIGQNYALIKPFIRDKSVLAKSKVANIFAAKPATK